MSAIAILNADTAEKLAAADVLDKAAKRVEAGWCRGHLLDDRGHVCALGALAYARDRRDDWRAKEPGELPSVPIVPLAALTAVLMEKYAWRPPADVSMWCDTWIVSLINDHYANNGAEIATCMRKAATNLRGAVL